MGLRLSFGIGPLRASVPLTGGHRRRRRRPVARRKSPAFHAEVRLPNGAVYKCHHSHRTPRAATECAAKYQRSVGTRPAPPAQQRQPRPQSAVTPFPCGAPKVGKPPQWWPRAGWGTIRNYRIENDGYGKANISFLFVPDDGGQPQPFDYPNTTRIQEMAEYARGHLRGNNLTIKVSADSMARAEQTFRGINEMPPQKRQLMFAERTDLEGDAGWTWTADYTLAKVAPGLIH